VLVRRSGALARSPPKGCGGGRPSAGRPAGGKRAPTNGSPPPPAGPRCGRQLALLLSAPPWACPGQRRRRERANCCAGQRLGPDVHRRKECAKQRARGGAASNRAAARHRATPCSRRSCAPRRRPWAPRPSVRPVPPLSPLARAGTGVDARGGRRPLLPAAAAAAVCRAAGRASGARADAAQAAGAPFTEELSPPPAPAGPAAAHISRPACLSGVKSR